MENKVDITDKKQFVVLVEQGNYENAVKELSENPQAFNEWIKCIGNTIKEGKDKATDIKERGFFKKMFSSNTKDLAEVLLTQNSTLSNFYVLLLLVVHVCKGNAALLSKLCQSIKDDSTLASEESQGLMKLASNFLESNLHDMQNQQLREDAIMKLLKNAQIEKQKVFDLSRENYKLRKEVKALFVILKSAA